MWVVVSGNCPAAIILGGSCPGAIIQGVIIWGELYRGELPEPKIKYICALTIE